MIIHVFRSNAGICRRSGGSRLLFGILIGTVYSAASTAVLYNPKSVSAGPFPSNVLTTQDVSTGTGVRIDVASTDEGICTPGGHASVCSNEGLLNTLDGFSVNPRVMACFSGPIQPATLVKGIKIVPVGAPSTNISLNQVIFDPKSNCAYGKPNQMLNQQSQYLLLVTAGVRDQAGSAVADSGGYRRCLSSSSPYCVALNNAVSQVLQPSSDGLIVSGSLFTTMSATSWLEDVHRAVNLYPGLVVPAGFPYVFNLANLQSIIWQPSNAAVGPQSIPLSVLKGVESVAFGLFYSPNYLNTSGPDAGTITTTSTLPVPIPSLFNGLTFGMVPVSFHVFLPSGTPPAGGWPLAIYGHGLSDNQFGAPTFIASTLAQRGIATIAMEITGHGFGVNSTVTVTDRQGNSTVELTPGRGVQLAPGAPIGAQDGCIVPGALALRDCGRQSAIDLFALVKSLRETGGLGLGLDASRIFYVGQSFGSIYGSLFHAVEPNVKAAVINSGGGTFTDIARLAITGRPLGGAFLSSLGLLNVPPASNPQYFESCVPGKQPCFNDEYPFRDEPVIVSSVPDSIEIQAAFEAAEWLGMLGDPLAYAPHFKTAPLAGVPPKATLFQFGLGDLEVPNPTESALVRAADGESTTWYFRFDLAWHIHPELLGVVFPGSPLPILPHRILSNPTIFTTPSETPISFAEQQQVASFFLANGVDAVDPNVFLLSSPYAGARLFERPAALPETLQYQQIPRE